MRCRYVVLHHTGVEQSHFDLLIEHGPDGLLAAWRCAQWPPPAGAAFEPLPDHRRIYLDYQGPISGGRGEVRRVASGVCAVDATPKGLTALMDSALLKLPRNESQL